MDETAIQEKGVSDTMVTATADWGASGCCTKHHLHRSSQRNRKLESSISIDEWTMDHQVKEGSSGSYSNLLRLHKHWAWHWSKSRQRKLQQLFHLRQNKCLKKDQDSLHFDKEHYRRHQRRRRSSRISISSKTEIELAYSSSSLSRCLKPDHNSTITTTTAAEVLHPDLNYHQTTTTTQTPSNLTTNPNPNQCLSNRISSNTSSAIRLKNTHNSATTKDDDETLQCQHSKPNSCLPKFTTLQKKSIRYNDKKKANSTRSPLKLINSGNWAVLAEITLFLILLFNFVNVTDAGNKNEFRCSEKNELSVCLPKSYSKFELPIKKGVNKMKIAIDIIEVLRINDKDYSITFACYFNVYWEEKRIRLGPTFGAEQVGPGVNATGNGQVTESMNLEFVKSLWLPNIFIYNLKTYKVIDVLSKLAGLWIYGNHQLLYSQATHITFICPMRFDKFPLDTQVCKFQVGSYSYEDRIMSFETLQAGYSSKSGNSIALDYAITINKLSEDDQIFKGGPLGNFSLAGFEMVLQRYVSTYIITYYLPSGLFVIVSWISFLIPMDVIPGRMALLVTLFLVLVNIFNTVTTNTPKAEGLTAIEAWMLACILFVFGALIE